MSNQSDEFVSAKNGEYWNPTRDQDTKQPKECTDNSYIIGTYMDHEDNQGPKKNSTIYRFMVSNLEGVPLEQPKMMSFWGSSVLDDLLKVKINIQPGMKAKVQWLGLTQPKKSSGQPYHDWDVLTPKNQSAPSTTPAPVNTPANVPSTGNPVAPAVSTPAANVAAPAVTPPAAGEAEDDLPF